MIVLQSVTPSNSIYNAVRFITCDIHFYIVLTYSHILMIFSVTQELQIYFSQTAINTFVCFEIFASLIFHNFHSTSSRPHTCHHSLYMYTVLDNTISDPTKILVIKQCKEYLAIIRLFTFGCYTVLLILQLTVCEYEFLDGSNKVKFSFYLG